ncbi:hypothetical protein AVEN_223678-1 [Araneus ventricosus]|uniref:Uncharacterized protein n=1 Tax=Araneus ventricosus TaxID=182803 RepID=A0A4Y2QR66_ARAVE|nr:hypothetical protein AVEN_223678-1 [Araneus ventricosus]
MAFNLTEDDIVDSIAECGKDISLADIHLHYGLLARKEPTERATEWMIKLQAMAANKYDENTIPGIHLYMDIVKSGNIVHPPNTNKNSIPITFNLELTSPTNQSTDVNMEPTQASSTNEIEIHSIADDSKETNKVKKPNNPNIKNDANPLIELKNRFNGLEIQTDKIIHPNIPPVSLLRKLLIARNSQAPKSTKSIIETKNAYEILEDESDITTDDRENSAESEVVPPIMLRYNDDYIKILTDIRKVCGPTENKFSNGLVKIFPGSWEHHTQISNHCRNQGTPEEHYQDVEKVLTLLHKARLTLKPEKCHFFQRQLEFLEEMSSLNVLAEYEEGCQRVCFFLSNQSKA